MKKSLMLYVHIPFCMQKCRYCDFLSAPWGQAERQAYCEALLQEIRAWKGKRLEPVTSVFIGGGTPSLLEPSYICALLQALQDSFQITAQAEQTLEANPGTITPEKARCWKENGINRISMGVQSMKDSLLLKLGRIHNRRQVWESYEILRQAGFTNLSLDLMMGLPDQTLSDWISTLKQALELEPAHLSCYSLIIEEGTPFYDERHTLSLPDEETERAMYYAARELLAEAGLFQYEISNFARPGYESRHNLGYWRRAPYLGLGLGASSCLDEMRFQNTQNLNQYIRLSASPEALHEEKQVLSQQDQMEEFMFLGLRCTRGVQKDQFARLFGRTMESVYADAIQRHKADGLLIEQEGWLRLTERGMDLANQVLVDFLL